RHAREGSTPVEWPSGVNTEGWGQQLGATVDRVELACLPEQQVDGLEGRVADTRRRVDGDQATPLSAVEDVGRSEVAMEKDRLGRFLGKSEGHPPSSVEQLGRDQRHEGGVALARSRPGGNKLGDSV